MLKRGRLLLSLAVTRMKHCPLYCDPYKLMEEDAKRRRIKLRCNGVFIFPLFERVKVWGRRKYSQKKSVTEMELGEKLKMPLKLILKVWWFFLFLSAQNHGCLLFLATSSYVWCPSARMWLCRSWTQLNSPTLRWERERDPLFLYHYKLLIKKI